MARSLNLLNARAVSATSKAGRYADGGGLYLLVRLRGDTPERLWVFRYKRGGRGDNREVTLSIGPARDVSLAEAREIAGRCRNQLAKRGDPREELVRTSGIPTFGEFADDLIGSIEKGFKNSKHRQQWRMTVGDAYCRSLRRQQINQVTTEDVLGVLSPIWSEKPETAARIRGRIERVLDAAKTRRLRSGENPARWRGHLDQLLPPVKKLVRGHHAALPWSDLPDFAARLRQLTSVSALALEFTILTATRTNESAQAPLSEIDKKGRVWVIPKERMKRDREHRVPLTERCIAIVNEMEKIGSDWLFPGPSQRKPLSLHAMAECLKGFDVEATVHGFRSTFQDWVEDATEFAPELADLALAHVIADKTKRAYRRGDALERRRSLMDAWETYFLSAIKSDANNDDPVTDSVEAA